VKGKLVSITFRRGLDGRLEAVHVVATITVVAEEQLVVILRGATDMAGLALDALPTICVHNGRQGIRKLHA